FLQFLDLEMSGHPNFIRQEAQRLQRAGVLSEAERQALDLAALSTFWESEIGRRIRAQAGQVHRELAFTARFSPADLAALNLGVDAAALPDEFLVVQGVADLAVILPDEIWLLDFKTD